MSPTTQKPLYPEETSFGQAETIMRNLASIEQESFVEVDQAMFELELQQVDIIRQVVLV